MKSKAAGAVLVVAGWVYIVLPVVEFLARA